jgi:hypothetical protein
MNHLIKEKIKDDKRNNKFSSEVLEEELKMDIINS